MTASNIRPYISETQKGKEKREGRNNNNNNNNNHRNNKNTISNRWARVQRARQLDRSERWKEASFDLLTLLITAWVAARVVRV
jgi:hypothetical protein